MFSLHLLGHIFNQMTIHSSLLSTLNVIPVPNFEATKKKYLYWIFSLALLMACLEFGQDYISSVLNENYFSVVQSLSYKLFWFLFVPFLFFLISWFDRTKSHFSKGIYVTYSALLISLVTLVHLLLFSLFLYTISYLIYQEPWPLYNLMTEKLSTRLYIGLSIYMVFSIVYYRTNRKKEKSPSKSIPVKNGRKTTLVKVDDVHWISSDGAYLSIKTADREHVILGSLKNIILDLPDNFKRIHRSTIVNIDNIRQLKSRGNGDYDIIMKCGKTLRMSRNYTKPLKGRLL